ncbi:MAG: Integral rane protein [Verrucomicrobiaceae bacterium]|nr:Integral rane protein [Verrucomicrobiaceae bacterium]
MTFEESIKTCVTQKYADFNGRASRSEYWWFALCIAIAGLVLSRVSTTLGLLFNLGLLLPSLAAAARRLHDTGRSGWWQLIALIPVLGWIVLIVFLALEGEAQDNQHGPRPLS